ncbi:MAG: hypothetical protein KatS3mg087_1398 [Patescibacteria group bacterium]|nr:MAG: hypothetical protein KatS3mg087_1398 [Patescibacteria group bacterium]
MLGLGLVVYGAEGVGKTSFALEFSNLGPLKMFSIGETGYEDLTFLKDYENVENFNVTDMSELYEEVNHWDTDTKFLVIDSLQGLQSIFFDFTCKKKFQGNWEEFMSYWRGPRVEAPKEFELFLGELNNLRRKGVSIILLGHMVTDKVTNTMGADYLMYNLEMDEGDKGGMRSLVRKWAQAILFMNVEVKVTRPTEVDRKTRLVTEGKAAEEATRVIYTEKNPTYLAKNRLGLPPVISMGHSPEEAFENFMEALPKKVREALMK